MNSSLELVPTLNRAVYVKNFNLKFKIYLIERFHILTFSEIGKKIN